MNKPSLIGHLLIIRIDNWFKNVFVLPGAIVAVSLEPSALNSGLLWRLPLGLLAVCLVASSNYVLNEVLDAEFDRNHPEKKHRPVPSGLVNLPLAYIQWLLLALTGFALSLLISKAMLFTMFGFWIAGCIYNIPPLRTKEIPFIDVVSEAINNPLRMLAGWYIADVTALPITSLLISYWMMGAYFMAAKRLAEYISIQDPKVARLYRRSFGYYNERRLAVSLMYYATLAMLFLGAFIMRYRLELIVSFPFISAVMALYLNLGYKAESAVIYPERLYKEPVLMWSVTVAVLVTLITLFVDLPLLYKIFEPSVFQGVG